MEPKINVVFSKIPKQEWRDFSAECRRRGDTIVGVLYKAIKEYMKGGKDHAK